MLSSDTLAMGGAYHLGIEIYGSEWSYGTRGVVAEPPRTDTKHAYMRTLHLGCSHVTQIEFATMLHQLISEGWIGENYDLLGHNCCSFARTLLEKLGVGPMPAYLDRFARVLHGGRQLGQNALLASPPDFGSLSRFAKQIAGGLTLGIPKARKSIHVRGDVVTLEDDPDDAQDAAARTSFAESAAPATSPAISPPAPVATSAVLGAVMLPPPRFIGVPNDASYVFNTDANQVSWSGLPAPFAVTPPVPHVGIRTPPAPASRHGTALRGTSPTSACQTLALSPGVPQRHHAVTGPGADSASPHVTATRCLSPPIRVQMPMRMTLPAPGFSGREHATRTAEVNGMPARTRGRSGRGARSPIFPPVPASPQLHLRSSTPAGLPVASSRIRCASAEGYTPAPSPVPVERQAASQPCCSCASMSPPRTTQRMSLADAPRGWVSSPANASRSVSPVLVRPCAGSYLASMQKRRTIDGSMPSPVYYGSARAPQTKSGITSPQCSMFRRTSSAANAGYPQYASEMASPPPRVNRLSAAPPPNATARQQMRAVPSLQQRDASPSSRPISPRFVHIDQLSANGSMVLSLVQAFSVGEFVKMQDDDDHQWRTGYVTQLKPLQVRLAWEKEDACGFSWDHIQKIEASERSSVSGTSPKSTMSKTLSGQVPNRLISAPVQWHSSTSYVVGRPSVSTLSSCDGIQQLHP